MSSSKMPQSDRFNKNSSTLMNSPMKNKFFFATRQVSDSVGEMEDPLQARRLKLSQLALLDDGKSNEN